MECNDCIYTHPRSVDVSVICLLGLPPDQTVKAGTLTTAGPEYLAQDSKKINL